MEDLFKEWVLPHRLLLRPRHLCQVMDHFQLRESALRWGIFQLYSFRFFLRYWWIVKFLSFVFLLNLFHDWWMVEHARTIFSLSFTLWIADCVDCGLLTRWDHFGAPICKVRVESTYRAVVYLSATSRQLRFRTQWWPKTRNRLRTPRAESIS